MSGLGAFQVVMWKGEQEKRVSGLRQLVKKQKSSQQ